MIRIHAARDGSYTIFRGHEILVRGLTREQADDAARLFGVPKA